MRSRRTYLLAIGGGLALLVIAALTHWPQTFPRPVQGRPAGHAPEGRAESEYSSDGSAPKCATSAAPDQNVVQGAGADDGETPDSELGARDLEGSPSPETWTGIQQDAYLATRLCHGRRAADDALDSTIAAASGVRREDILTPEFLQRAEKLVAEDYANGDAYIKWLLSRSDSRMPLDSVPACVSFGHLSDEQRIVLVRALSDPGQTGDSDFVAHVAAVLATDGNEESLRFLRSCALGFQSAQAKGAGRALAQIGDAVGIRAVEDGLRAIEGDNTGLARADRAALMSAMHTGIQILQNRLRRGGQGLDPAAILATQEAQREAASLLCSTPNADARESIVWLLDLRDDAQHRALVDRFENDPDVHVREAVVQRLRGPCSEWPQWASDFVLSHAGSPDPVCRRIIIEALGGMAHDDSRAEARLAQMAGSDPDSTVRSRAQKELETLSRIKHK